MIGARTFITPQLPAWADVRRHGAIGSDTGDQSAAINDAIDAVAETVSGTTGGFVYVPRGVYRTENDIVMHPRVTLRGDGDRATIIKQVATDQHGITGVDIVKSCIEDLRIEGPGSGTGDGIHYTTSSDANFYGSFRRLQVYNFGGHGVSIEMPIMCKFERVTSESNGGRGFHITGQVGGTAATSCSFDTCWATSNTGAGYRLHNMTYCAFTACGADANAVGYTFDNCGGIALSGCGAENNPTGFAAIGGYGITLAGCFIYDNGGIGVDLSSNAGPVTLTGCAEISPDVAATAFVKTTAGCRVRIDACTSTTPNNLAAGTLIAPGGAAAPSDHGLTAWTYDPALAVSATTPTSGVLNLTRVHVRETRTISNILVGVGTAGTALTSGQNLLGLYTSAGTLVGQTADQTTAWGSASTKTAALTAPYIAQPGFYWVGILSVASTTTASFARAGGGGATAVSSAGLAATAARFGSYLTGQTALPASLTLASIAQVTNGTFWAALS